ncbi:MAG: DNA polymerase III subunit gamma/tau [Spirochaetaceae bacterium]|nr:DNA polymerase III subunit gamma/tau [Spirochaetaceae bacterium]
MSYEVTATRRRPKGFNTLLGQEFVSHAISGSISGGRIAHAYLFAGPRGVGKTSSARILARSLNCKEGPTATPCGVCDNCIEIAKGSSLDVIEIDGASNTGVGDVREIKEEVQFPPTGSKYKIYIIDEVHMLSISAFNALLKTIEEPPPYIIFIFATTEIHKVPATIRSRCQQYNFRLIATETIKEALAAAAAEMGLKADSEALFWLAKEGAGSMRDAYTLFDQAVAFSDGELTLAKIREKMGLLSLDELNNLIGFIINEDRTGCLTLLDNLMEKGVSVEQFITDFAEYLRNLLLIKNNLTKEGLLGAGSNHFNLQAVEVLTLSQLEMALDVTFKLFREIKFSINPRFELELALSKLCVLKYYLNNYEITKELAKLQQDLIAPQQPAQIQNFEAPAAKVVTAVPAEKRSEPVTLNPAVSYQEEAPAVKTQPIAKAKAMVAEPEPAQINENKLSNQQKIDLITEVFDGEIVDEF